MTTLILMLLPLPPVLQPDIDASKQLTECIQATSDAFAGLDAAATDLVSSAIV